jgi:histone deacetylase 1/2
MGSAVIPAPLLPTPNIPPSTLISQCQSAAQFGQNRGHFNGSWRSHQFNHRGHRTSGSRPDFRSFHTTSSNDNRQGNWQGNWQRRRGSNPRCQLCQAFGHTAPHCPQLQQQGYGQQHSANLALHNPSGTAEWFPDTGAKQHVTLDLATLTASEPYLGNDNLHVGDGKGLSISHIGHTKLYTPHRSFTLFNVLHVPAIMKSLLFVQKFCLDNNVYFEFHPFLFYVNDLNTNEVLLSGQSKYGLYTLSRFRSSISSVPQAYWSPCISASADLWHRRLGHPTSRIFQLLVSKNKIICNNKHPNFQCQSCPLGKSSLCL